MRLIYEQIPPNELYHHGILNQRWGIRRFQPYPKGYKGDGKFVGDKSNGMSRRKQKKLEKKISKEIAKELVNQKNQQVEQETYEQRKERALKVGSASEILSFQADLTTKELQDAASRIEAVNKLKTAAAKEISTQKSTFNQIDDIMKKVGKVNGWVETGTKSFEQIDKVMKMLDGAMGTSDKDKGKKKK